MNKSKIFLVIFFSIFVISQAKSIQVSKQLLSYPLGIISLGVALYKFNELDVINYSDQQQAYDEKMDNAALISGSIAAALNTFLRSDVTSKKEIVNYLVSLVVLAFGIYKEYKSKQLKESTKEAAEKGRMTGYLDGIGLGILGSSILLDIIRYVSKLK